MAIYQIFKSNITRVTADAIAYSANINLSKGSGISRNIFNGAGERDLLNELKGNIPVDGDAIITKGYALPARYIIHAVIPYYDKEKENVIPLFSLCIVNTLKVALEKGVKSFAIPCLGTGSRGWNLDISVRIIADTIKWVLDNHPEYSLEKVIFVASNMEQQQALETYLRVKHMI